MQYDVAIVGGGPGGSTTGTILKKYNPDLNVLILEKEKFPRDHIGESQLPYISYVLEEMGCWDKVEAADFPIKIGATFKWGVSKDLWDFEFYPASEFQDEARPAKFKGQRRSTAFQVDRSIYDKILLDHARELGCEVREETMVKKINKDGDRITSLTLANGEEITARHYVDASGNPAIIRRAMGINVEEPSELKNVAFWDYWQNTDWAVNIGVGATRIQIMSLGYGWIWFIPLGPTRTSIGLVCPAVYYKSTGMRPEDLYMKALEEEPRIKALLSNATRENRFEGTKDWSYVSERMAGDNWFLVGEAAGFADPILSAGLTLTHASARETAYTIMEIDRGELDAQWLKDYYTETQARRVRQHIRFADFWYTANSNFTELKEFTQEIARDAGLELNADKAWRWIGTGGFVDEGFGASGTATFSVMAVQKVTQLVAGEKAELLCGKYNVFKLRLQGAERKNIPMYEEGRIRAIPCYYKEHRVLPVQDEFALMIRILQMEQKARHIVPTFMQKSLQVGLHKSPAEAHLALVETLEAMMHDGWIVGDVEKKHPLLDTNTIESTLIHKNVDNKDMATAEA